MEVCVVGTGYVGLVTGTCLAYLGHSVVCVDIDERKIEMLRSGRSPIYEPGLDQLIASGLQRGNLRFSTDISKPVKESEVIFIAVGTPPLSSGKADLSYVKAVAQSIGRAPRLRAAARDRQQINGADRLWQLGRDAGQRGVERESGMA